MNIIESWLATETTAGGRSAADALRDLNAALGRRYTHSHLSRWRRGVETPKADVLRYMAEISAEDAVREIFGITPSDEEITSLVDRMTP